MGLFIEDGCTGTACVARYPHLGVIGFSFRPANGRAGAEFLKARSIADQRSDAQLWQQLTEKFVTERLIKWWTFEKSGETWTQKSLPQVVSQENFAKLPQEIQRDMTDMIGLWEPSDPAPDGSPVGVKNPDEAEKN